MNFKDILRRSPQANRREFLRTAANGIGAWALSDLLAADGYAAGNADAALRAEGQERHLPVHGRRPQPI